MPRFVSHAVCAAILLVICGCGGRFQRSKYDPFSTSRQSASDGSGSAADYPRLISPGTGGDGITQAGSETYAGAREFDDPLESDGAPSAVETVDARGTESAGRPARRPLSAAPGHAPDHSWIQGRLEYTHLSGGIWRVRYASLSDDDAHGGCVILQSAPPELFKAGDMVFVEGRITEMNGRGPLPNPVYQVDLIQHVR